MVFRRFANDHDFLNNVIAFGVLAATLHLAQAGWRTQPGRMVARRAMVVALFVVVLELLQLALPARSCDWHDVLAGWVGITITSMPWVRGRPSLYGR